MRKSWRYSTHVKFQGILIIHVGSFEQNKQCFRFSGVLKGEMVHKSGIEFMFILTAIIRIFKGNNIYNKKYRLFLGAF